MSAHYSQPLTRLGKCESGVKENKINHEELEENEGL